MTIIVSEKGSRGRPGLVWRGEWSAEMDYYAKDVVTRDGSSYIARRFIRADPTAFPRVTADWDDFALKGADGAHVVVVSATEPTGSCSVPSFLSQATCETDGHVWSSIGLGDLWYDTSVGRLFARISDGSSESWYDITGVILGTDVSIAADGALPAGTAQSISKYLDDRITTVNTTVGGLTSADIPVVGDGTLPGGNAQAIVKYLDDRINLIEADVNTLETDVNTLETDVNTLDATDIPVAAHSTFLSGNTQVVLENIEDRIEAIELDVDTLDATNIPVAAHHTFPGGNTQTVVEHIEERIEAIELDVDTLDATDISVAAQGTFPSASAQSTVKHLDDRITALSFGVESLQATDIPVAAVGDLPAGDLQSVLEHLDEKAITSAVDPTISGGVVEGNLWYDTNSNQINVYRDNTWVVLATKAALGDNEGYDDISMNGGYF